MVTFIAISALALATLAEWLHWHRCHCVARLAFPDQERGSLVILLAGIARIAGLVATVIALGLLWNSSAVITNSFGAVATKGELDRMIIIMDASKSMNLTDAGPDGQQTRADRARELIHQLIDHTKRMPLTTLMTFGESALPVVYDAKSWDVLDSVLLRAYYSTSFKSERTAIDHAIHKSLSLAEDWIPDSTVAVLVTDGDSVPSLDSFQIPPAIRRFVVLGVGSPEGRPAGRNLTEISRLEVGNLHRIEKLVGGEFFDATRKNLPDDYMDNILPPPRPAVPPQSHRNYSLLLFGLGVSLLAAVPLALSMVQKRVLHIRFWEATL